MITKSPYLREHARKLKDQDIIDILNDHETSVDDLAARYNVTYESIVAVYRGKTYKHITLDPKYDNKRVIKRKQAVNTKLTDEAVIDILNDKVSSPKQMAEKHGIHVSKIFLIHKRKVWKHITSDPKYTTRDFRKEITKLNPDIVYAVKNRIVTDLDAVAKQYGVTVRHLMKLRCPNCYDAWKTIPNNYVKEKNLTDENIIRILRDKVSTRREIAEHYGIGLDYVEKLRGGKYRKNITCDPRYMWKPERPNVTGRKNQDGITDQCDAQGSV